VSTQENKALIHRFFAAIDAGCKEGDADILDDFMAPDFVEHNPFPGIAPTRDGWKEAFRAFVNGAPGSHVIEHLIAEEDMVAARITAYGMHTGELFGVPAKGKEIRVTGTAFWRIKDGKIVEHWHETDQLGLLRQLGVLPSDG
jgi:steroid delta-isomerase-like uncharacterized protein